MCYNNIALQIYQKYNYLGGITMRFVKYSLALLFTALLGWGIFLLWLPPVSLASPSFWGYIITIVSVAIIFLAITERLGDDRLVATNITTLIALLCVAVLLLGLLFSSAMFNAKKYHSRLSITNTTFENEFQYVNWDSIPQIDANSAKILGARKMGTLVEEISQFEVAEEYTLINYNGRPVRIAPLVYSGLFKYYANKDDGIPGYIIIDCVDKSAEFVRLESGMKYSPSAYWGKDLKRHLRSIYPNKFFEEFSFEINDEGTPFYVVPTYKYSIGIGGGKVPEGCILVNPISGDTTFYSLLDVPEWVDHSISDSTAFKLINSWGSYADGFANYLFTQKNVKQATEGSAFVTMNNDVWLYTGITSVAADESNIGFILINQRTAEARYFEMPSAEEYSAMDSARGQVQHLDYSATFPILINLNGEPVYFLSLKDSAGLVKMYSLVSVEDIQKLTVTDSALGIEHLVNEYRKLSGTPQIPESQIKSITFTITSIHTCVIEGNTQYYFGDEAGNIYMTDITQSVKLPLYSIGDTLSISYTYSDIEGFFNITKIN